MLLNEMTTSLPTAAVGSITESPTARANRTATKMRRYYEDNRAGVWGRMWEEIGLHDGLMLGLLNIVLAEYIVPLKEQVAKPAPKKKEKTARRAK